MKALFIYPIFPKSFWSFEKTLELVGRKAMLPPLGLITVAALVPQEWEMRLVDRNVTNLTDGECQTKSSKTCPLGVLKGDNYWFCESNQVD